MLDRTFDIITENGVVAKEVPEDVLSAVIKSVMDIQKVSSVVINDHVYSDND